VPGSGWAGNLLVIVVWAILVVIAVWLVARLA